MTPAQVLAERPDSWSVAAHEIATLARIRYVPALPAKPIVGFVESSFTVIELDAVPPAEVPVQANRAPAVSVLTMPPLQGVEVIVDSPSVTLQLTVIGPVLYQPFVPTVPPATSAAMTGGVASEDVHAVAPATVVVVPGGQTVAATAPDPLT